MNRTLFLIARVSIVVALAATNLSAQPLPHVNKVHGSNNAPMFLAVLADHYSADQEEEFNQDVQNFFKYGLLVDAYYSNQANNLKIVTYFDATPPGKDSIYDFSFAPNVGNCAVTDGDDTLANINKVLGTAHPSHVIVLANHAYNIGCTDKEWTYIAVDAVGTDVLPHEMGHIVADLFDEFSSPINKVKDYDKIIQMSDTRNCWPVPASNPPHWMGKPQFPGASFVRECDLFGRKIFHPYDQCRMGTHSHHPPTFCLVCREEMDSVFQYMRDWQQLLRRGRPTDSTQPRASHDLTPRYGIVNAAFVEQPAVTPDVPVKILRIVVRIDPDGNTYSVRSRTSAQGIYVPSYRRNGRYLYEYREGTNSIEVGVIPDRIFTARGYRGGAAHMASDDQPGEFVIAIPNEDLTTINFARNQTLTIYRIPDTVTTERFITPLNIGTIRSQLIQVGGVLEIK